MLTVKVCQYLQNQKIKLTHEVQKQKTGFYFHGDRRLTGMFETCSLSDRKRARPRPLIPMVTSAHSSAQESVLSATEEERRNASWEPKTESVKEGL